MGDPNYSKEPPIKRTSITLSDQVYETGLGIAARRGFGQSFSAYVAWLIQRDAQGGVLREDVTQEPRAASSLPREKKARSTRAGRQSRSSND